LNIIDNIKLLLSKEKKFAKNIYPVLGFVPWNVAFYKIPFIHRSSSIVYKGSLINYERLEYLGDAVLDLIVAEYLFKHYRDRDEGFLSQMRSKIVKRQHLNETGIRLGLAQLTPESNGQQLGKNYYGDVLEALIGALFLKRGYRTTKKFVIKKVIGGQMNLETIEKTETDFKSRLIEWAQKNKYEIRFECNEKSCGEGKVPYFTCRIYHGDVVLSEGEGETKKEAEQDAAEHAIRKEEQTS